jgi:1,4-alpha-glucan branching enzyme
MTTLRSVTFQFPSALVSSAKRVAVVGAFNSWDPTIHPLVRTTTGNWTITIYLPPGRYVYCFDVDGTAWVDPSDHERIPNRWGSEYSVRYVPSEKDEQQQHPPHVDERGQDMEHQADPSLPK